MPADRRFGAMGSAAHVIVVGAPSRPPADADLLCARAQQRIAELERRWSRFLPDSEVSRLNRGAGTFVEVSAETRELVERAVQAWELTAGLFDPTVLGAMLRAGYERPFGESPSAVDAPPSDLVPGADAICVAGNAVRLPAGTGFDPGGLGKGLAADIVVDELRAEGAAGVCVNLGGDIRVDGVAPEADPPGADPASSRAWTIAIEHPARREPIGRAGIARGAIATSTTLVRRWHVGGESRHHLIDPATGAPSTTDLPFVTVVAGFAWVAEVFAKAALLHGTPHHFDLLRSAGAEALAVDTDGRVLTTPGMSAYLAGPPPDVIAPAARLVEAR